MSESIEPLQSPPPPLQVIQQAYTTHSGHGSIGPVIGVLAVMTILCAIAVMIGRFCSGRRILGRGQFDFEGWIETKCASCIDGRVDYPPPPRPPPPEPVETANSSGTISGGDAAPAEAPAVEGQEAREEEITRPGHNGPRESAGS